MGCSVTFLLVRRLLDILRLGPSPDQNDVDIAVLSHQVAVLRRQVARPRYSPTDRAVLATLARFLSRERRGAFLVSPAALLGWHRDLIAGSWAYPDRGTHNALAKEVVDLVLGLARENPRWRYLRTVGECPNLSVDVSATATRKLLRRYRLGPAPRTTGPWWSEPLKAQAAAAIACDLFYVDTVSLRRLYVLFFIDLDRRMAYLAGVTAHPVGPWPTPQARNLEATFDDQRRPFRFLARDRGTKFVGPSTR